MKDSYDKSVSSHRLRPRELMMGSINFILALITVIYSIPTLREGTIAVIIGIILIPILRRSSKERGIEWTFLYMIVLSGGVVTAANLEGNSAFGDLVESLPFIFIANGIAGLGFLILFNRLKIK